MSESDEKPLPPENALPQSDRRRFLQSAAALGGLGLFGSCAAPGTMHRTFGGGLKRGGLRGKSFTPIDGDEPVRIGVIGTGGMGTGHCHSLANLAAKGDCNLQVVAVSDLALPRMNDIAVKLTEKQGFILGNASILLRYIGA